MRRAASFRGLLCALTAVALAVVSSARALVQPPSAKSAEVHGVVTDINGARMKDVILLFRGKHAERRLVTTEAGTYVLQLPAGDYSVEVRDDRGSCPVTRGPLSLPRATTVDLDFTLYLCPIVDVYTLKDESAGGTGPPASAGQGGPTGIYRLEEDAGASKELPYRLQVWFVGRREQRGIVRYTGLTRRTPVTVAYNLLTIHADAVLYNRSTYTLTACGNVIYQDGHKTATAAALQIRAQGTAPQVTLLKDDRRCVSGPP